MGSRHKKISGTPNRLGFITSQTGGHVSRQERGGSAEVLEVREQTEETPEEESLVDEAAEAENEATRDTVEEVESGERETASASAESEEEKTVEKVTGDIKPEGENLPGAAKASPAFREVEAATKASAEEEAEAIEENSLSVESDDNTEE